MVSLFGRGFDSRQLHRQSPPCGLFFFSRNKSHKQPLSDKLRKRVDMYLWESYDQGYSMSHPSWVANAHYEILPFDIGNKRTRRT